MRFFKVSANVSNWSVDEVKSFVSSDSLPQIIDEFNREDTTQFCFLKGWDIDNKLLNFGVVTKDNRQPLTIVERFAKAHGFVLDKVRVTEQLTHEFARYLEYAEEDGRTKNRTQVLERFGISAIANRNDPSGVFWRTREHFIDNIRKKDGILEDLIAMGETGVVELIETIFDKTLNSNLIVLNGISNGQNNEIKSLLSKQAVFQAIAESLWDNDYIKPQRYSRVNLFSANDTWRDLVQEVVCANNEGLVVIDMTYLSVAYKEVNVADKDRKIADDVRFVCDVVNYYSSKTIFVLALPINHPVADITLDVLTNTIVNIV